MTKAKLYICKFEYDNIDMQLEKGIGLLCDYRRSKVERLKLAKPKLESMITGLLWQKMLVSNGYRDRIDEVVIGEYGKPEIKGVHFNLSNTLGLVVGVIADVEVGVDVEVKSDKDFKITNRFYTTLEKDYVYSTENDASMRNFRKIWTMKEAFIKLTGTGMKTPLLSIKTDPKKEIASMGDKTAYYKYILQDEYCISIASFDKIQNLEVQYIEFEDLLKQS